MGYNGKKCLILANGDPPKKPVFDFLFGAGYNTLICADGGANSAFRFGLKPDYVIGDLDSIEKGVLKNFSRLKSTEVIKYSRQNDTDVEKALKLAIKKKFTHVILLGATGNRLDHTFCNMGIALKFDDKINVTIIHGKSVLTVLGGKNIISTSHGEIISIYGFDDKTKITSKGLKYPLKNSTLPFGKKESTSNVAIGNEVFLKIVNGKVFVIREFEVLRRNGFFS